MNRWGGNQDISTQHCCCFSVAQSCPTLCDLMDWNTAGFPVLHYLLEFAQTHVHGVDDAIQPSQLLLPPSPPVFNLSQHQGLSQWVSSSHQVNNVLELQHQSFQEYSGLISFRIYWFAFQGTLKSLFQHHSSKVSILQRSAFFRVQLLHLQMTTGKTIPLTRWTFVNKVMYLHFNTLSRFVIASLPRIKCLLISWLQSPSAVILEPPQNKVWHCFHCFPIFSPYTKGSFISFAS